MILSAKSKVTSVGEVKVQYLPEDGAEIKILKCKEHKIVLVIQ